MRTVIFYVCFTWVTLICGWAYGEELRIGNQTLEHALDLPMGTGAEQFNVARSLYVGNLPDDAAKYDVRAAHGRLDYGEIGAYLAAQISGKPVTGTTNMQQTLLLMRYASQGGGHTGPLGQHIKDVYQTIKDLIDPLPHRNTAFF